MKGVLLLFLGARDWILIHPRQIQMIFVSEERP